MFHTANLTSMQRGRLNAALDKQYLYNGVVKTLRDHVVALAREGPLELSESDGMIDYARSHFNRLPSQKDQGAYIARLKVRRYFYVNGWVVPKLVHDALRDAAAHG